MNKDLVFKISKGVVVLSLFIVGIMLFFFKNSKPIISGYIFGTSISILSFFLINDSANKLVRMDPSAAKKRAQVNYILRYLIYFIVLSVAAIADYLNLFATFFGLTMIKNTIYILTKLDKDI